MLTKIILPALFCSSVSLSACAAPAEVPTAPEIPAAQASTQIVSSQAATAAPELSQAQRYAVWKKQFIQEATSKGYDKAQVRAIINPAKINERALDRDSNQPEFSRPIWVYVDGAVSADRLNRGKSALADHAADFNAVTARYPVDRNILTAIWGLETSYGRILGNHNIVDALSTFAFEGRRQKFGTEQLYAVLDMLRAGDIRADQLTGSWAGAMGMTQFIPATFRDYAVDLDGDGNKNLWESEQDALGSAAHYLARHGWRKTEPVITEIRLPAAFDYSLSDGLKKTIAEWEAFGVNSLDGRAWSQDAKALEARLLVPAGHKGPKLLAFKNFDVIMKYNRSTSYALGISSLASSFQGQPLLRTPWPRNDKPISFTNKKDMQKKLTALGYDTQGVDGQIGPNSRRAIRAWQAARGLPADGYMEQTLFKKLMAE
ncbi:MAG: lytic murein transglycosylase [Maricaulaceae bacterium]